MKTFTKLAQANLNHYNAHPVAHNAITAVYGVAALVFINVMARKIGTS